MNMIIGQKCSMLKCLVKYINFIETINEILVKCLLGCYHKNSTHLRIPLVSLVSCFKCIWLTALACEAEIVTELCRLSP